MTDYTDGMHPPLNHDQKDEVNVVLTRKQALNVLCNIIDSLTDRNRGEWERICEEFAGKQLCYHDILKPFGITQVEISHVFEPDDFSAVDQIVVHKIDTDE